MAAPQNSRKFPTLTEVVDPSLVGPPRTLPPETAPPTASESLAPTVLSEAQVEALIQGLGPSLELELRRSAHAMLDVQLTSILPDLHQRIEALVRKALAEGTKP